MAGGDQLVIDLLAVVAEVAGETAGGADGKRAKVGHAARDRLLVRPAGLRVLGAPAAGGTVAGFALDAVFDIDLAGDEARRNVRGVAIEADGFLIRLPFEAHVAGHARGAVVEENVVGLRVAVAVEPRVVLVLQDARGVERFGRTVAAGVDAGGDAFVVAGSRMRGGAGCCGGSGDSRQQERGSSVVSSSSPRDRLRRRRLADGVERSVAEVEPLHLGERHRARADAVEDRDLIAAFVDGAIAVEALRDRQRRTVRVARGDEARRGTRTEAGVARRPFGRE